MAPAGTSPDVGAEGEEISDHELIKACQKRDSRAFEILMMRHRGNVYAMIQNMIKNASKRGPRPLLERYGSHFGNNLAPGRV